MAKISLKRLGLIAATVALLALPTLAISQNAGPDSQSSAAEDVEVRKPQRHVRPAANNDSANPSVDLRQRSADAEDVGADPSLTELRGGQQSQPLSVHRILEIFEQEPDLLDTVKQVTLKGLKRRAAATGKEDEWQSLDTDGITDDAFFRRLETDADLHLLVSRELTNRGFDDEFGGADRAIQSDPASIRSSRSPRDSKSDRFSTREQSDSSRTSEGQNEPRMQRLPSPYPTLPSLQDLYSQYPVGEPRLKRFGSDVFRFGTGNANDLPMDVPAGPDYVLGPGDGITLNLWGSVSQRISRTVDRQGQLSLPEAGAVSVAGLTIAQAQDAVQKALSSQYQSIRVEISLARLHTVRIYVVGDVQRPGAYDISSLSTPLNALYAAGGPTSRGSLRSVLHYRGKQLVRDVDLYDFLLHGQRSDVDRLIAGDTILVPPTGAQVTVSGAVRRPAIYELRGEQNLKDILDLAGGLLVSANLRQIGVERVEAHQRRTMLNVPLPDDGNADGAAKALAGFHLQDGDRVLVTPILPYNEKVVYLQGHVYRPGKYPYRDGITVNELLRSYQDLLPEPADHAEIVRLQPPDFRPTTIGFALSDVLTGDDPITLQPFDVIRVYSRYQLDPPKVLIHGEVLRPGEYPLAQGMTVVGLLQMAGGFKRSAYRQEADLSSYVIQNGDKVLTKNGVIDLAKALEGDKAANLALKPGDVVTIRQLTGWKDIGAAVTVRGEVVFAGVYGIHEGERLSSVLKRAGGFRDTAYPAGAVLEREQVRELAEKARLEMIRRVETGTGTQSSSVNAQEQLSLMQAMQQQQTQVLAALRSHPASGRQVIRISANIKQWENTSADIELRAGDVLLIPKRPTFVLVSGQVYNSAAITYAPGRNAGWYLHQAGGATSLGNRKDIFIVRADGSVVGRQGSSLFGGNVLSARMQPGDSIVVPDKPVGGSAFWRNLISSAQLMSSVGLTAAVLASNL